MAEASLLELDGTIVYIAASFVVFTIVMQKVFYGPITKIREKRAQQMHSIKQEAESAMSEADRLSTEYTEKIKDTRRKIMDNNSQIMSEANQEKARILVNKKQETNEIIEAGRKQIQEEKEKSLDELMPHIGRYADEISGKILGVNHARNH